MKSIIDLTEKLYSKKEVANIIRVSPSTVSRELRDGKLSSVLIRGQRRIAESQLRAYLNSHVARSA